MRDAWPSLTRRIPPIARWTAALLVALGLLAAPRATRAQTAELGSPRAASSAASSAQLGRELGDPAAPTVAQATPSGWSFDLAAVTSFPLSVGAEATLTSPVGLFAQLSVGHTPQAYLGVIAGALADADVYDDELGVLVDDAIANGAWNVRAGVGFTIPAGLELSFGYTWLTASADLSPSAIEAAIGQRVRWPGMTVVPMSVTLHALYGRLGWRFVVEDHFVMRASLGWTHTVGSETHVEVPEEIREQPDDPATRMETAVADGLSRYGFTPELVLSAGYRF